MTTTIDCFSSYAELLEYGRTSLRKHRQGLLEGYVLDSETGLDESCSGEVLDMMEELNHYVFTTGSTNTYVVNQSFPEPMWVALWIHLSDAIDLAWYIKDKQYRAGCLVQHLSSKKVLLNTMDMNLHRWWTLDAIEAIQTDESERIFLQQCSLPFAARGQLLFDKTENPVVGMWIEYDDETTRTLYHFLLDYFQNNKWNPIWKVRDVKKMSVKAILSNSRSVKTADFCIDQIGCVIRHQVFGSLFCNEIHIGSDGNVSEIIFLGNISSKKNKSLTSIIHTYMLNEIMNRQQQDDGVVI